MNNILIKKNKDLGFLFEINLDNSVVQWQSLYAAGMQIDNVVNGKIIEFNGSSIIISRDDEDKKGYHKIDLINREFISSYLGNKNIRIIKYCKDPNPFSKNNIFNKLGIETKSIEELIKESIAAEEKKIADANFNSIIKRHEDILNSIQINRDICEKIGFQHETENMSNCILKLFLSNR